MNVSLDSCNLAIYRFDRNASLLVVRAQHDVSHLCHLCELQHLAVLRCSKGLECNWFRVQDHRPHLMHITSFTVAL